MDKSIMLDKIRDHYGFPSDATFARYLGISPQALYNWRGRNSFDAELLYSKCPELSPAWLLSGKGAMMAGLSLGEKKSPYFLRKKRSYLEKEIELLSGASKIMDESGNQIKRAIGILTEQIKAIDKDLGETQGDKM